MVRAIRRNWNGEETGRCHKVSDGNVLEFVQFYLDDFDCPELVPSDGWEGKQGTMGETHKRQRQAYHSWGVGYS